MRAGSFSYKDYSKTSQMAAPYIGEDDAPAAVSKLFATVDDKIQWSVGGFVQPFLDSFDTPLTYGMTEYAGRSYSERGTNYGYGGRTSTNVIIRPKNGKGSMIAPASGRVLLAKDLGGLYGNTLVIEHGAGLKSIFYGLASLDVKTGDTVKQGQLLGGCSKAVVAEMRIGTVPIDAGRLAQPLRWSEALLIPRHPSKRDGCLFAVTDRPQPKGRAISRCSHSARAGHSMAQNKTR